MFKKLILLTMILSLIAGTSYAGTLLTENEMDEVSASGLQIITNDNENFAPIHDQENNLDSVQLNNSAQSESVSWSIINSAKSAVNVSANVMLDGIRELPEPPTPPSNKSFTNSSLSQSNTNTAINHQNVAVANGDEFAIAIAKNKNKEKQFIENNYDDPEVSNEIETGGTIEDQDNNNNSVQLNDNAQQYAKSYEIINSSTSAINVAANIFVAAGVSNSQIYQSNSQYAENMSNFAYAEAEEGFALAIAANKEEGPTQQINNTYVNGEEDIVDQDNNNNSVQVNDNAQQHAIAQAIINLAQSAANASGNIASMGDVSVSIVSQSNVNIALNHSNTAVASGAFGIAIAKNKNKETQIIHNMVGEINPDNLTGLIDDQDNNNNSVQLNDNAQQYVKGILLENLSMSAANAALNLLGAGNISGSNLSQYNYQYASNFDNVAIASSIAFAGNVELSDTPGQYIHNLHATISDQDNNNNSVQLNDNAQANIYVDKAINAANSAVNAGQNLMYLGDVSGSTLSQTNIQIASNHNNYAEADCIAVAANINKQTQVVDNCFCSDLSDGTQDNNMNSVQLNDNAQANSSTVLLMNLAESAANAGLNVITSGTVSGSNITQSNTNIAINFSNTAVGGKVAISANAELPFFGF